MEFLLVLLLLAGTTALITAPLWRGPPRREPGAAELAALEAAKAAKLCEIRDAELDFQVGKLSADDYRALDRQLRGEAVDLLHRLDAARGTDGEGARR